MLFFTISIIAIFNLQSSAVNAASLSNQGSQGEGISLLKRLLKEIRASRPIEDNAVQEQLGVTKRSCRFGWNAEMCRISEFANAQRSQGFLESASSPGKRSSRPDEEFNVMASGVSSQAIPMEDESVLPPSLMTKVLAKILYNMRKGNDENINTDEKAIKKRTCRLRLGGHCNTEALDKAANAYYYYLSGDSPGKRRRRSISPMLTVLGGK